MARLRMDKVRARFSSISFDYRLRPYTFRLADYFIRGSEHVPSVEGIDHILETVEIQDIQQALGQMYFEFWDHRGIQCCDSCTLVVGPSQYVFYMFPG